MLLLMAAAVGLGFLSGSNGSMPWMILFSTGVVVFAAVMAIASAASVLGVIGFALAATAAFQVAFVMTAVLQEAALSRTTRQASSHAVRN